MIPEMPFLPEGLKQAYDEGKLVVFIGAGVSRLAGCKSWEALATSLIKACYPPGEASLINGAGLSSKERITMAYEKADETGTLDSYWETFKKAIIPSGNPEKNIYEVISKLNTLYITTNCDGLMEEFLPVSAWTTQCEKDRLENLICPFVFYLHGRYGDGSEAEKQGLVFTVESYLNAYQDPKRISFLKTIFASRTVLFIGYGLSEFELIDFLFEKSRASSIRQHYILEGYYSYQEPLYRAKSNYYKSIGVKLIPYSKDQNDYEQQLPIISEWVNELLSKSFYNADIIENLHKCLQNFNTINSDYVRHYIDSIPEQRETYLKAALDEIPKTKNQFDWIKYFWTNGIVKATDCPPVIERDNKLYSQSWDFLTCLRTVVHNYTMNADEQSFVCEMIHQIVTEVQGVERKKQNKAVSVQLLDVIFLLDPKHINNTLKGFVDAFFSTNHFDAVIIATSNINYISRWPKNKLKQILEKVYSVENSDGIDLYSIEDFTKKAIGKKQSLAEDILPQCFRILASKKLTFSHFEDIESQLERDRESVSRTILKCIDLCFEKTRLEKKEAIALQMAKKARSSLQIQAIFYIATKYSLDDSFFIGFKNNPLGYSDTRADLYYYLEKSLEKEYEISESSQRILSGWIEAATFGFNQKGFADTEENRARIAEYINSFAIQLLELLEPHYSIFHEQLEQRRLTPSHHEIHPREHAQRSFAFSTVEKKTHFSEDELRDLTGEAILSVVKEKLTNDPDIWSRWGRVEVYNELIEKLIDKDSLREVIDSITQCSFEEITDFTSAISTYSEFKKLTSDSLWRLIKHLYSVLCIEKPSENREICLSNYIRILENVQKCKWRTEELVEFCLDNNTRLLWTNHAKLQDDYDVITAIINENESVFYDLIIDLLCEFKENESVISKGKKYFAERIYGNPSIWLRLSLCLKIQSLYYLDQNWCEKNLNSIMLGEDDLIPLTVLSACSGTHYVIKSLTEVVGRLDVFKKTIENLSDGEKTRNTPERVIQYVTSAYAFNQIGWDDYVGLIDLMQPSHYNYLIFSILMEKNGELCELPEEMLCRVCNHLRGRADEVLANAIYKNIRFISQPSDDIWEIIEWSIAFTSKEQHAWYELSRVFSKLSEPYLPGLKKTVLKAIDHFDQPYLPWLKKTLSLFSAPERKEDFKEICNRALARSFYPSEITEFLRDPSSTKEN